MKTANVEEQEPSGSPSSGEERERQGVQSVEVGGQILAVLAAASGPSTLSEIARNAGMSASKVHRYLVSLAKSGLVRQDRVSGRYDLGEAALRLGLAALNRLNVVQFATEAIIELNQKLDVTTLLSIWSERGPVVVGWYDSSEVIVCNVHVGSLFPLLRTATGRVFLAFQPRRATDAMVRHELRGVVSLIPNSRLRTLKDVDDLIREVRRDRLGVTREEFLPGLSAVSAPVFDHQGRIAAAIAILGVRGSVDVLTPGSYADMLRKTADDLSRQLGFVDRGLGSYLAERLESG
jgi:DNA-binding IclR family transcriptional regulator